MHTYRDVLKSEYLYRHKKNTNFSQNAFANMIGVSPSLLSEVLSKKHNLSVDKGIEVCKKLRLSSVYKKLFISSIQYENSGSIAIRSAALEQLRKAQDDIKNRASFKPIEIEKFNLLAEWYHFAILELIQVDGFKWDVGWISKKLGLDQELVQQSLNKMLQLKIVRVKNQTLVRSKRISTGDHVDQRTIRDFHRQMITKALGSIDSQSSKNRFLSSNNFAVSDEGRDQIIEAIKSFRREVVKISESCKGATKLYSMNVQLFRLCQDLGEETNEKNLN